MFRHILPIASVFLFCLNQATTVHGEPGAVTLHVQQNVTSDMGKVVKFQRTQHRSLIISLTNTSSALLDVSVKHIVFGRSVLGHDVVVISDGERPLKLGPLASEQFETTVATAVAVETHYDITKKVKVEGSGASIIGHGVQVLQGGKVIAEAYEPLSLKEDWGKAKPLTPTTPAAPAK